MDEHAGLNMTDSVESLCKAACIVWMCYFSYLSTLDEGSSFLDKPKSCKRSNSGNCAPESEDPSEDDEEIRYRTDRLGRWVFVEWSWDWYTGIGF
jgi:hypothetical protein